MTPVRALGLLLLVNLAAVTVTLTCDAGYAAGQGLGSLLGGR